MQLMYNAVRRTDLRSLSLSLSPLKTYSYFWTIMTKVWKTPRPPFLSSNPFSNSSAIVPIRIIVLMRSIGYLPALGAESTTAFNAV